MPVIVVQYGEVRERLNEDVDRHFKIAIVPLVASFAVVRFLGPRVAELNPVCIRVDTKDGVGVVGDQAVD